MKALGWITNASCTTTDGSRGCVMGYWSLYWGCMVLCFYSAYEKRHDLLEG